MTRRVRFTRNVGRRLPAPLGRRERERYVRFEHATETIRGITFGPFSYLSDARAILHGEDLAELNRLVTWFVDNLDEPNRMTPFRVVGVRRARRERAEPTAQCWFREDATAHVAKARELVALLERAGFPFIERASDGVPGKLCAEDDAQVAVVPYRDTRVETVRAQHAVTSDDASAEGPLR